ncbi:MAG: rod shape-determining protein MreC [Deinococcales bacterium]
MQLESFRKILGVRVFQSPGVVSTAPVTGVSSSPLSSKLTLGAGKADGVLNYMPITVPSGLVGIVTDTSENSATVRTILDPLSRVGITVKDKGGQGIAIGQSDGRIRVIEYFEDEKIAIGDTVETQSRGGLFPRGILVGEVISILPKDPNKLTIEFLVKPAADIPNLIEVSLIKPL